MPRVTGPFLPPRRRRHSASIVCNRCSQLCWLRDRFEPESQHALPCMQLQPSPRGATTSSKEPRGIAVVNPHHSSTDTAKADVSSAARASTGAQHHLRTAKKHRTKNSPRALRRSILLPIGERRRGPLPLHQWRRGRRARLRVLLLDGLAVFTSHDTDVPRGRALYLTL